MFGNLLRGLRALAAKGRAEQELDDELSFHLEKEIEENVRRGMSPEEARREAFRNFGGVERVKEECRDVRGGRLFETLFQDVRYGMRVLLKQRGFTAVAVATLALGIGANTAIFSVVNTVLLRPLAFPQPERLVGLWESLPAGGTGSVSVPNLRDWREQNNVFEAIAAYQFGDFSLQNEDQPQRVRGLQVSPELFGVLGMAPQLGRTFAEGEDRAGNNRVVVLSDQLWRKNFGASADIVGRSIVVGGEGHTVVGVMPADFRFPTYPGTPAELWVPLVISDAAAANRGSHAFQTIGRLGEGVTLERAQDQMSTIARRIEQEYPAQQTGRGITLVPVEEVAVQSVRPALLMLLGAVGFVLLIACTNVANLLLARAAARRREIAIRSALGAGRGRLVRQFLTESVLLALAGGALGLLLARWGVDGLSALAADLLPRVGEIGLDWRVLGFTLLLSLVTGVAFGLAPALQASKADVQDALKDGGNAGSSPRGNWLRSILAVAEVASALVLLIGAGLLIKSFQRVQNVETGFNPENVLTVKLALPAAKYDTREKTADFHSRVIERVSALPGVEAAGSITLLPVQQSGTNASLSQVEGREVMPAQTAPLTELRSITPDYFRAMGIPLLRGRFFNEGDRGGGDGGGDGAVNVIVNKTLAEKYIDGEDPIGRRIRTGQTWLTIVGVVGDVRQTGLTQAVRPEIFTPHTNPWWDSMTLNMTLVARASGGDPHALAPAIRREVLAIDPNQPVHGVATMEEVLNRAVSARRLNMMLLSIFAGVAMVLAVIGIYSVMSYLVTQHTREIGIRMALGAQRRDVLKLVLGQGLLLTLVGVGLGAAGAVILTRLMSTMLFEVKATDPLAFVGGAAVLVLTALVACYVPARRAMRVDPMTALRYE